MEIFNIVGNFIGVIGSMINNILKMFSIVLDYFISAINFVNTIYFQLPRILKTIFEFMPGYVQYGILFICTFLIAIVILKLAKLLPFF